MSWDKDRDKALSEALVEQRKQEGLALTSGNDLGGSLATVQFNLKYKTAFGQGVKLIGSDPRLGGWWGGRAHGRAAHAARGRTCTRARTRTAPPQAAGTSRTRWT